MANISDINQPTTHNKPTKQPLSTQKDAEYRKLKTLFSLFGLILFSVRFMSSRFSSHFCCCVSFYPSAFSRKLFVSKAFSATYSDSVSNAILQWARVVDLKNFCGYACSKQSTAIKVGLVKEGLLKEGLLKEGLVKEESVLFRA